MYILFKVLFMQNISVIIPAYNEERRIISTLIKINNYLKTEKYDYEIIVIDDGSKDRTVELVQQQGFAKIIRNPGNKGKGYSVKQGMLSAKNEWILFSDADLSTPIEELDKFKPYAGSHEVMIGSRCLAQSKIALHQPFYRELPGKIFGKMVKLICLKEITDSQCGFKLFSRNAAQKIFSKQTINRFGFDVEILYLAKKYGYSLKEIPITWTNDRQTRLNLFTDSISMFKDIIKIRINDLLGKYNA